MWCVCGVGVLCALPPCLLRTTVTCVVCRVVEREHWQNQVMEELLTILITDHDTDGHVVSLHDRLALSVLLAFADDPNLDCAHGGWRRVVVVCGVSVVCGVWRVCVGVCAWWHHVFRLSRE